MFVQDSLTFTNFLLTWMPRLGHRNARENHKKQEEKGFDLHVAKKTMLASSQAIKVGYRCKSTNSFVARRNLLLNAANRKDVDAYYGSTTE